jgi:UDP-N-acetyl-D-mannosaminuronic acid dehydrogenase
MRIGVIGLGMAGLPLACIAAEKGFHVVGVDVDERRCREINKGVNPIPEEPKLAKLLVKHGGENLVATSNFKDAKDCCFYIVIVPLFIDEKHSPDFTSLKNAITNLGKILKKGDCVVLETTVPPGTTETMVREWLEKASGLRLGEFYLAHSPERIMTGYSISRLKEFPKVIGGVNKESGQKAYDVYQRFIGNLTLVSSARVAEFVKVIEGCYRNTNIALANELFKIADELHIDFYEARNAANHRFCDIHLPSTGVGGHCIPVYPWFLINEMEKRKKNEDSLLLKTSTLVNDEMIYYWADKIIERCKSLDKPLEAVKICVKGISFRKGVKSLYYSRNLALVKLLQDKGLDVYASDPLLSQEEIEEMGLYFVHPSKADVVFDAFNVEVTT